jgi:hypothetical protein
VLIADPAFDRADVQREIDELRLRHTGAQLEPTLAEVAAIVQRAELRHSRLNETRVCFFTDMGKTTWDDALSADARKWWTQLSESATLQLFDVGVNEVINRSIARIAARQQLVTPRRDVTFDVEVVQRGGSAERSWVEFFSDGNRVERRSLDVGPNQPAAVSFTVRFDEPGDHYIECRLPDDDLPLDNSRWRSVRVRKDVRVLCIEGKPGAARHVALALAPQKEASARRVIVDTATETALLESDLHQYAAIFLCNVAQFREEEASALHRYVQRGGATVFFLGDQVNSENYNERLASDSSHPLLPCTLGSAISGSQYMFDPRGYHHPLLEAFRGHEQAGLLTTPVWKYIQLTTLTENGGQTALEFEGGDPAIVDGMSGRGRCLVVATAASTESVSPGADPPYWSAMSSWPSFLPLTQELLQAGLSRRADERNRTVGEPLFGEAPPQTKDVAVSVALPRDDGRPAVDTARAERVTLTKVDTQLTWGFAETYWSGIYTAEFQTPERSARYFAANVDVREGDPTRIAPGEIPSQLQRDYTADGATASPGFNAGGQSFFRYLLAIVFGLVLCESFLASQFGRTWK